MNNVLQIENENNMKNFVETDSLIISNISFSDPLIKLSDTESIIDLNKIFLHELQSLIIKLKIFHDEKKLILNPEIYFYKELELNSDKIIDILNTTKKNILDTILVKEINALTNLYKNLNMDDILICYTKKIENESQDTQDLLLILISNIMKYNKLTINKYF
jgi:hypothetical protein